LPDHNNNVALVGFYKRERGECVGKLPGASLNFNHFLRIDPNTGVIALRASLDREIKDKHVLTVIATGKFIMIF